MLRKYSHGEGFAVDWGIPRLIEIGVVVVVML